MGLRTVSERTICILVLSAIPATSQPNVAAWDVLKRGLSESNPDKRKQAVLAVGTIGPSPEVIELMNEALRDKDIIIRLTAAAEIGDAKLRPCVPTLQAALNDTGEVAFVAAKALWDMGDRQGRQVFEQVVTHELKNTTGFVQGTIRDAKEKIRNPRVLARMGLMEASGALLGPFSMGITVAQDMLKDTGAPTRALSYITLSQDCDARGAQLMEWALTEEKNNFVRAAAAKALGRCGNLVSVDKLVRLMASDNVAVRYMSAASVVRLTLEKTPKPAPPPE